MLLRHLLVTDPPKISAAFSAQGWDKPVHQYEQYLKWQDSGIRDIIVAEVAGEFAGYLTILWVSDYPPFRAADIPEIVDEIIVVSNNSTDATEVGEAKFLRNLLFFATGLGFIPALYFLDWQVHNVFAIWGAFLVWMVVRSVVPWMRFRKIDIF